MSDLELQSRLYAWLGNRTSKADGDAHDHESLLRLSADLATLVGEVGPPDADPPTT